MLLQRQGEISGALLPQWLSGYAFVFSAASDAAKARELAAAIPAAARSFSIGVEDAALRPIAERIALNARDAGLAVSLAPQGGAADVRLLEVRIAAADPARALAAIAAALGLPAPPLAPIRPTRFTTPSAPAGGIPRGSAVPPGRMSTAWRRA